jgi:hypothetical protein
MALSFGPKVAETPGVEEPVVAFFMQPKYSLLPSRLLLDQNLKTGRFSA